MTLSLCYNENVTGWGVHPENEPTDEEAAFNGYEEWENTLIHFELANSIGHKPRIEARARRIEEAKERKKRSRKNKDKTESEPTDSPDKPEST